LRIACTLINNAKVKEKQFGLVVFRCGRVSELSATDTDRKLI